ncbi:formylglycine-generating enzyme family protein [Azospirillum sp. sgz302134]
MIRIATISCALLACFSSPALASDAPAVKEALVPAGRYYVGPVFGKQDYRSHANTDVGAYYIMTTEVNYRLYRSVLDWGARHGYELEPACDECFADEGDGEKPIHGISWIGAAVWANAFSEMSGKPPFYVDADGKAIRSVKRRAALEGAVRPKDATGYRLPSLEEWHVAARGARKALDAGTYGYRHSGSDRFDDVAWHAGKSQGAGPARVGSLKPNQIGLYDMSGNVAEWTATPATDLSGSGKPTRGYYYYCGESWANTAGSNLAFCDFHSAGFQEGDLGFRLVRSRSGP